MIKIINVILMTLLITSCSNVMENKNKMPEECLVFEPKLIWAIIQIESGGNQFARGDSGKSIGLMQVKLTTAQLLGFNGDSSKLEDRDINLKYGCLYLYELYIKYNGNIYLALDAYSRGPETIRNYPYHKKWDKHPYVGKIIREINSN